MGGGFEPPKLAASRNNVLGNPLAMMESNIVSNECRFWAAGTLEVHGRAVTSDYDFAGWNERSVRSASIGPEGRIATIRQAHRLVNEIGSGPGSNTGDRRRILTISATGKSQTSDDHAAKQT